MILPVATLIRSFCNTILPVLLLVFSGAAATQAQPPLQAGKEIWGGTLDANIMKLRLQLNLEIAEDGTVTGQILSPDQSSTPMELEKVTRTAESLGFQIARSGAGFAGEIDADGQIASGLFRQGEQVIPLEFRKLDRDLTQTHEASWLADYQALNRTHQFQLRVFRDDEDNLRGKLDIFSEGTFGLPCEIKIEGTTFKLDCKILGLDFTGELDSSGDSLEGTWQQDGIQLPVKFTRIAPEESREARLKRVQVLEGPFPYKILEFRIPVREIDFRFETNVAIAGAITMPEGPGPFPTVLMLSDSGAQDRNHEFLGHPTFAILADYLTRQGFAVIRCDDRGVGASVGPTRGATTMSYTNDAEAIYRWAQKLPEIDTKRFVLLGYGEGSLVASLLAMRQPDVAGVIFLSGHAVTGREIIMSQTEAMSLAQGLEPDFIENLKKYTAQTLDFAEREEEVSRLELEELAEACFGHLDQVEKFDRGVHRIVDANLGLIQSSWLKFFIGYDPRPTLAYLRKPVLSLYGENDRQVVASLNAPELEKAIMIGANPDFQQHVLPGLNHLFQPSATGSSSEYITNEITIDESVLQMIADWLNQRFK